jgi:NodT family efflux transporter outer membrane factor (OMF) lipoprotein
MVPSRLSLTLAGAAAALTLASCAPVPALGPKPVPRTAESVAATRSLVTLPSAGAAAWPVDGWWTGYADPQLSALIEEGLRGSPDVAAAAARYRRAAGLAQQAGAALLPALDVQGKAGFDKQSYNNGFPKEFVPKGWLDTGRVAADLQFDLDLWGRNRAALAAATSDAQAAEIDTQQARLMLTTGIADAYADLARLYDERDIQQGALDIRQATRKLVDDRLASGLDTRGDLRQAESSLSTARADVAAADEAIALRRNQLAALLGAGPDRGLSIARPSLTQVALRGVPAGVTTDLVGRRPDVAAARARVEAAARRVKVARADFFPAISLDALVGVQSLGLENLAKSDSTYGSVGPAFSLPIFHGGALSGQYRGARGAYDEAVADYDRIVVDAYREVADAVTSQRMLDQRMSDVHAARTAAEAAYAIARQRYEGGLSTYLDVLTVEERLLLARQAEAELQNRAFALDIALIRALGGGFDAADMLPVKDIPHG